MSKTQIDGKPVTPVPANIPEELAPIYEWIVENGRSLAYQVAIVVLAVMVAIAFTRSRAAKLERASAALLSANDVVGLEEVAGRFGGTKLGPLIKLRLARAYYDAGQFDSAKDAFGDFAKANRNHPLIQEAKLGLAASHEALREFQQAIDGYRSIGAEAGSPVYFLAKMGEARSLAASGDKAAAREIAVAVAKEAEGTPWEGTAEALDGMIDRFDGFHATTFSDQLTAIRNTLAPTDAADVSAELADDAAADEAADDEAAEGEKAADVSAELAEDAAADEAADGEKADESAEKAAE